MSGFLNLRFKLSFWYFWDNGQKYLAPERETLQKKSGRASALSNILFSYPNKLSCPPSLVPCSGILAISVRYSRRKNASVTNSDATSAMG